MTLHGLKLETILVKLVEFYGWNELGNKIITTPIN
ncbi:VF530 family DNA-binding protein [Aliarcobacter cibarius]